MASYSTPLLTETGLVGLLVRCAALATVGFLTLALSPVLLAHVSAEWCAALLVAGGVTWTATGPGAAI